MLTNLFILMRQKTILSQITYIKDYFSIWQFHHPKIWYYLHNSRQCSGKVVSGIGSNQSCFVLVVSVLDVLGQPVLGPVDLLTVDRNLEVFKDDPELVMLHLVVDTVVVGHSAVPLLLILEVIPHSLLQSGKVVSIFRLLGNSQDLGKENIMLPIKPGVISCKGSIPNIRLRHFMLQMSLVAKVSILNVLSKPILSPLNLCMINWGVHLSQTFAKLDVLLLVFLAVVPGQVQGITELSLLIVEMISHQLLKFVNLCLVRRIVLNSQHDFKQANMLIIELLVKDFKLIVPHIRL